MEFLRQGKWIPFSIVLDDPRFCYYIGSYVWQGITYQNRISKMITRKVG